MYKIIDYAGETFKDGFATCERAYSYLYISYNTDFIHEMGFRIVKEEEINEFVACGECEGGDICFVACNECEEGGKDEQSGT